MKYFKQISILLVVFLVSCSDDFIDLAPISEGNAENFYKTPADFESAIVAVYNNLQSNNQYGSSDTRFGGGFYALMEVRADDAKDGQAGSGVGKNVFEIDTYVDNPLSSIIEGSWSSIFKTIFEANVVITRIENITIDASLKNEYLAEARFLRALSYFNAVRLWGDVPVILNEISPQEAKTLTRNSITEVYKVIEDDFKFAADNLPISVTGKEGRATSGAAKAFLGKVYLTEQKWNEAATILQEVVGKYQLLSNVEDVFDITNELNDEIIFSVRFKGGSFKEGHLGFGTPEYTNLLAQYDVVDKRLALLDVVSNSNGSYPKKQFENADGELGRDFIVLRYADVLLMLSEALNEIGYQPNGNAFNYLNDVRNRAGVTPFTSTDLTNQAEFRKAVLNERRLELPLELHRWFDLLRTNNAIQAMAADGKTVEQFQLLYPIPQNEINVYNNPTQFPQNTGY
ncbi:RagB/SusD family nutrient uptake outer membrane protein [Polaribacter cellanae]|uniref:RagB/SusD family nutrient uptake outer membrane protein n=1 Tax=Polaribacter cellanae TaxID=2818493 RepID=A0A975CNH3_9FLAO|nr:RagB/SusD family nutrient uptake outer membrane protein [Polaribacter cellanae]QTE22833.1 RagB/SusD family nutrient uptake outer membrane protein [Polaribacter cellanae]